MHGRPSSTRRPARPCRPTRAARPSSTCPTSCATRRPTTWSAGCAPRSACSARWSRAAAVPGWRCRAATTSAPAGLDMHMTGLTELGAADAHRARVRGGRGARRPARQQPVAGLPERRRHREPADGRGAGRGHHGHRQRGPRAGDHRPVRDARGDGRPGGGHLHLDAGRARRRPAPARAARHRLGPDRGRHLGVRGRDRRRRPDRARRPLGPPRHRPGQARVGRRLGGGRRRRLPGGGRAPAGVLRRGDAALPGLPYRPPAVRDGAGGGQRRHRDGHRERLRGALHVRPGARPAGRRPAHRRPPRRGPRPPSSRAPGGRHDIRAGAALVLAGLAAQGTTVAEPAHRPRLPVLRGDATGWAPRSAGRRRPRD